MAEELVPQVFRKSPEAIVSYNWSDIRDGTGYAVFYGSSMNGTTYVSPNTFYSGMIHKNGGALTLTVEDTYYQGLDVDFDIIFNRPKLVFGDILVSVPFGIYNPGAISHDFLIKATLDVYHYDGSTETQIGSTATSEEVEAIDLALNEELSHITTFKVNASSVVNFKVGETLRCTIKVYAQCTDASGWVIATGIGCDPMNRTDVNLNLSTVASDYYEHQVIETNNPTQLKIQVPFRDNS
jgi:hypothetical protein